MVIRRGHTIAFVPTMGFLHEGHLALMKKGIKLADQLIVSIFVNPAQFGQGEDLDSYPESFERDVKLCEKNSVDVIFHPDAQEIYPERYQTYVNLEQLPDHLCGLSRPVHFRGVATVVTKLFNIVKPHIAIFGMKDYQQLAVLKQMVVDLNQDIDIVGVPTVREPDGLAMSSRNAYLTPAQRRSALSLIKSLNKAEKLLKSGIIDSARLIGEATDLIKSHKDTSIDYLAICDPETLVDVKKIEKPVLMAVAVKIGKTRLIDNIILNP